MNWLSKDVSEVSKNKIWRERTKKLEKNPTFRSSDYIFPYQMEAKFILSKPISTRKGNFLDRSGDTLMNVRKFAPVNIGTAKNPENINENHENKIQALLKRKDTLPPLKYSEPQTSSQEVGWILPQVYTSRLPTEIKHRRKKMELGVWLEYAIKDGHMSCRK